MQSKIRSLASDTVVYGVSTVVGRFLTFFLTPLYTNYLTASEIGDVTALYAMIAFVNIVYSLGLEPAFMRFWERDNDESNRVVFTTAFIGVSILGIVATAVTVLLAPYIAQSSVLKIGGNAADIVRIAALIPLFDALVLIPFSRLRMQRKPRTFALLRLAAIIVNVTLNIVFVIVWGMRVEGVVAAGAVSSAFSFLLFLPSLRLNMSSASQSFGVWIKKMFRFGLPTVPSSLSSIMVQVADRSILLMMTSSATVGLYQTNFRLALPLMMFVTVFEYAWKPFYLQHRDEEDAKQIFSRVLTLFTVVCGGIFITTAMFIPYIVQMPFVGGSFINPLYWSGLNIIPIVMFAYFFNGVFINMAAGPYITMRTMWLPVATGVAAVLNVGATFLLVPSLDITGAAWAKVLAYAGSVVVLAVYLSKVYPIRYDITRILTTMAICAAIYLGSLLVPEGSTRVLCSLLALPLYVVLLLVTRVIGRSTLRTLTGLLRR